MFTSKSFSILSSYNHNPIFLYSNMIGNDVLGCNYILPVKATFCVSIHSVKSLQELAIALISSRLSFQVKIWCTAVSVAFKSKVLSINDMNKQKIKLVVTFLYPKLYKLVLNSKRIPKIACSKEILLPTEGNYIFITICWCHIKWIKTEFNLLLTIVMKNDQWFLDTLLLKILHSRWYRTDLTIFNYD